jgi:hypothetical protein
VTVPRFSLRTDPGVPSQTFAGMAIIRAFSGVSDYL